MLEFLVRILGMEILLSFLLNTYFCIIRFAMERINIINNYVKGKNSVGVYLRFDVLCWCKYIILTLVFVMMFTRVVWRC